MISCSEFAGISAPADEQSIANGNATRDKTVRYMALDMIILLYESLKLSGGYPMGRYRQTDLAVVHLEISTTLPQNGAP
jgi:hypothetical protein